MRWAAEAEKKQTWTTSVHGLEKDEAALGVRTLGIALVSPIQCGVCATHRIPALHLCYWCLPEIVVNLTVVTIMDEGLVKYRCRLCSTIRATMVSSREQIFGIHLPKSNVEHRYPFTSEELEVVAARGEKKYNRVVKPRSLPLRQGICILHKLPASDPTGATGLNWFPDAAQMHGVPPSNSWTPLPRTLKLSGEMCRTNPLLDCRLCQSPGCSMVCGTAATEAITVVSKTMATQFQMQRARNCFLAPPFPTTLESGKLEYSFNMGSL